MFHMSGVGPIRRNAMISTTGGVVQRDDLYRNECVLSDLLLSVVIVELYKVPIDAGTIRLQILQ